MTLTEALTYLVTKLADFIGPVLGFVLGWGSFELQELRKRRVATQITKDLVVVELRWLESTLSMMCIRWGYGNKNFKRGIGELRWFFTEGIKQPRIEEVPSELLQRKDAFLSYSDEQIANFFAAFPAHQETQAVDLPLTAINTAIEGSTAVRLSTAEIRRLIEVKWQAHMLTTIGQRMNDFYRMTFTVSGEENHKVAVANNQRSRDQYRERAGLLLDCVRRAISELDQKRQ